MKTMRLLFAVALIVTVVASVTIAQGPPAGGQGGAGAPPAGGRGGGAPGGGQGRGGGAPGGGQGRGGGRGGPSLMITSPSFPDGGEVPAKFAFGGGGENKSPEFKFNWIQGMNPAERPATVQTYAIIFHDIENSTNRGTADTLHWSIYNIPGTAAGLPEGLPAGVLPDGSTPGPGIRGGPTGSYFGPGAPSSLRYHHYVFEFYALDSKLEFPAAPPPSREQLMAAMEGKIVGKAAYVGRFRSPAPAAPAQ